MDTAEIQKRLDVMPAAMNEKGCITPDASFVLTANGSSRVSIRWYKTQKAKDNYRSECEWFTKGDITAQLDAADAFIAAMPSKKHARMREFMAALGGVIDLGKETGIEVEFLNPLTATMKKLSENALTDQRVKVEG